ncbi:MAG: pyridoxamine 5'-phosphate oxidase family protein [Algibacter sp.]|uniref:pyridoxamine 5'-phosphate oxidase family protein n=1 Tax=Algibacter sp. TaxID=1872428 RepID=UPI0026110332|nr:pyridoxamine 5'-phosphate oxidase family protein [Algibacter sp.]MDG1730360.1 pyridoxamine 5'-phosphate oxidase family protein [Algibacter sp.]MDG2178838.1 pyridoxamine 5'-phosphate oxidase family protein [Algibacter sp.]
MISNLEKQECLRILQNNYIGHLAYVYKNAPFIVPITYFYDKKNITIVGYSGEGHKTNALRINSAVALEVAEITAINNWQSIIVHGTFKELSGPNAKHYLHQFSIGIKKILANKENKVVDFIREFSGKTSFESIPIVYQIKIEEITGKERKQLTHNTIN